MSKVNCKSDFTRYLRIKDLSGKDIGWPDFDWAATFWTFSKSQAFTVGVTAGVSHNCHRTADGRIRVVFNDHRLLSVTLKVELIAQIPDEQYPDRLKQIAQTAVLKTELTCAEVQYVGDDEEVIVLPILHSTGSDGSGGCSCVTATEDEVMQVIDDLFHDPDKD